MKSLNQKKNFEFNDLDVAKKTISEHFDRRTDPGEILVQQEELKAIETFCSKKSVVTAMQQTIVNGVSEVGT